MADSSTLDTLGRYDADKATIGCVGSCGVEAGTGCVVGTSFGAKGAGGSNADVIGQVACGPGVGAL